MGDLVSVDVRIEKEQMVTDSRNVSETFGKRHDHVLRDINNISKDIPNFGEMFFETTMADSYGRGQKVYLMNRDGFTLLAMGFTGSEAMKWKLKYIEAFNALEKAWNTPEQVMARALKFAEKTIDELKADNQLLLEEKEKIEQKIEEDKPKVDFADHVSKTDKLITVGTFAKILSNNGFQLPIG